MTLSLWPLTVARRRGTVARVNSTSFSPRPASETRAIGRVTAACLLVGLVGCDCGEPLATLIPDVVVSPGSLDWGTVVVGLPHIDELQIGNRGSGTLDVVSVSVEPVDAGFAVVSAPSSVQPQRAAMVVLELSAPLPGDYAAELVVLTDDPETPEVRVPLAAVGGTASLAVDPDPLDFGRVNEGPGASQVVTLTNDGFDFLTVRDAAFVDGVGFVVDTAPLPASLAPGEVAELIVHLRPDATMLVGLDEPILQDTLHIDATTGARDVAVQARINLAPIARAVERDSRQTTVKVATNELVTIDGSETVDPENDPFVFRWSMAERPTGSIAGVVGYDRTEVTVTPDAVGRYIVRLRATDAHGAWREADVTILPRDLAVVLTWETSSQGACQAFSADECAAMSMADRQRSCCGQSDLDLHLLAPGGVLGDYGRCPADCPDIALCSEESDENVDACRVTGLDCAWANRSPEWGPLIGWQRGRVDDPRLDIDDSRGSGPEIISLNSAGDGDYRVVVHFCYDRLDEPTLATVQVFDQGVSIATTAPQLIREGQAWLAAVLRRRDGRWEPIIQPDIFENAVPADLCSRRD